MGDVCLGISKKIKQGYQNKPELIYFLLLVPFIEPQLFKVQGFEFFDSIYGVVRAISAIFIFLSFVLMSRRKPNLGCILMMMMQSVILFSTFINHGSLGRFAGPAIISVSMFVLMDLVSQGGNSCLINFFDYTRRLLCVFLAINIVTWVFVGTKSTASLSFLGIDNRWIYLYLPLIWVSFSVDTAKEGKPSWLSWTLWLVCLLHLAIVWAAGAVIAILAWAPCWLLFSKLANSCSKRFWGCCVLAVFFLLNIWLVSGSLLEFVSPLIRGVMHKDVTLAGRTLLWKVVIETVGNAPLFGRGVQSSAADIAFFLEKTGASACAVNHPHNYLLNVLFHGGYIAAVLFCVCHIVAVNAADKHMSARYYVPFLCLLVSYLLASLVDTLDFSLFYVPLGLASACYSLSKDTDCAEKRQ